METRRSLPDIKIHLFDVASLGGLKARRVIYSGTEGALKMGNIVHRTVYDGDAIAVGCQTFQSNFSLVANDFKKVIDSFAFLPRK